MFLNGVFCPPTLHRTGGFSDVHVLEVGKDLCLSSPNPTSHADSFARSIVMWTKDDNYSVQ